MEQKELASRTALVTGASRNIGRAISVELAAGGANVLVHAAQDRNGAEETADLVRQAGSRAEVVLADLTDPEQPARLVQAALGAFGGLDIVVSNAAVRPEANIRSLDFATWRQVMSLTLDAAFLLARAAVPALERSPGGSVILIGGMSGHSGAKDRIHVISAKAGLVGFGKALAHDLGAAGITVNTVSPGLIETKRTGAEPGHHVGRTTPLGRRGLPEEVAAAVRMLVGPSARYITGQTLHVNGGALMA